jgi:ATP synthase I subunit
MGAMAGLDDLDYPRVVGRITRIIVVLGVAGSIGAFIAGGWSWAAGFALGGAASWLSFRWLKQMVGALGVEHPESGLAAKAVIRYLLIGGVAYVIVKYTVVNLRAALTGLLLSTAAVIVEILIELIYARD